MISYISIVGAELGTEKGNHLIEGLLAAIPAKKHYTGKMLGICFLITFQLVLYAVFGLVASSCYATPPSLSPYTSTITWLKLIPSTCGFL